MATFQSQINILAAGQHKLHQKIDEITDLHLIAKYDSLETIIMDDVDDEKIVIEGLGYRAFDCMLTVNNNELHFMDYKGLCEDFTLTSGDTATIKKISINTFTDDDSASIAENGTLNLYSKTFTSQDNYDYPKIIQLTEPENKGTTITEGNKPQEGTE